MVPAQGPKKSLLSIPSIHTQGCSPGFCAISVCLLQSSEYSVPLLLHIPSEQLYNYLVTQALKKFCSFFSQSIATHLQLCLQSSEVSAINCLPAPADTKPFLSILTQPSIIYAKITNFQEKDHIQYKICSSHNKTNKWLCWSSKEMYDSQHTA